jgi:agmatinase
VTERLYPHNFMGLDPEYAAYETARVAVLPLPYDATCSYKSGAARGPAAIVAASNQVELWDEELDRDTYKVGIATLDPVAPAKDGPESEVKRILAVARGLVADGKFILGLGGEHTVSIGVVQALKEKHPTLSVLQIDAHLDLRDEYEGTKYSHASVMRRIAEMGCPIVSCGVRAFDRDEWHFAQEADIAVFRGRDIHGSNEFIEEAVAATTDPLFVTIDLDGLDPTVLPSTGTPEPGGMGWYQTLALLRALGEARRVVGCDVVELSPDGVNHHSDLLAARLAYKMLGYFVKDGRP